MTRLPGRPGRQSALVRPSERREDGRDKPSRPCPVRWIDCLSQSTVTPSLIAFKSGSPRSVGTVSSRLIVWSLKIEKSSPAIDSRMTPSFFRSEKDLRNPMQSVPPWPDEPQPWMIFKTLTPSRFAFRISAMTCRRASSRVGRVKFRSEMRPLTSSHRQTSVGEVTRSHPSERVPSILLTCDGRESLLSSRTRGQVSEYILRSMPTKAKRSASALKRGCSSRFELGTSTGNALRFTVNSSDNDLPQQTLTFSLGAGAPSGASIDATTGVFTWRPSEFQGGATNRIAVTVRDSGTPSLSATQTFDVRVRDTQGDFILAIGSTNLFTGETNSVPIALETGTELSAVSFLLQADTSRLKDLSLSSIAGEIASSSLQPLGANQSLIQLTAASGETLLGSLTLARLQFNAISDLHSAIVPLQLSEAQAVQPNGNRLARPKTADGRAFVIGEEPLLDAMLQTNGARTLVLYGRPNRQYTIEAVGDLADGNGWSAWQAIDLLGSWIILSEPGTNAGNVFYRAVNQAGATNALTIRTENGQLVLEWPLRYENCQVEQSTSLTPPVMWTPIVITPQRLADRFRLEIPVGAESRIFRLACGSMQACVTTPTGMIAWWPGDGNARDVIGTNHGVLRNGAGFAPGKVGSGFHFDGVDDYINVGRAPALQFYGTAPFTFSFWIAPEYTGSPADIITRLNAGVGVAWELYTSEYNDVGFWTRAQIT